MGGAHFSIEPATEASARKTKKKKAKEPVGYIPQELVFSFLLHVPAQALHDSMRRVCREWNLLISSQDFIHSHLRNNSVGGLIFEDRYPSVVYVEMRGDSVEITSYSNWGEISNSCNGLILTNRSPLGEIDDTPLVINPITKQRTTLPPYQPRGKRGEYFSIAFAESSKEYKVVCSHKVDNMRLRITEITVLTIGVDSAWRDIFVGHLSMPKRATLMGKPHVTVGYMHWVDINYVLTLNVETEEVRKFALPPSLRKWARYLPMGGKLSAVDQSRKLSRYVWEMDSESGEWTVFHCIDLKPLRCVFKEEFCKVQRAMLALGWLVAGEVLVFEAGEGGNVFVAYSVRTKGFQTFEMVIGCSRWNPRPHVNSLFWCKG